jgi:ADP-heptose:LPS heptosyltransferase
VTLLCQRKTRHAFDHVRYHDELLVIDDFAAIRQNFRVLASTRFHAVLDLEPFRRMSSIIAFLAGKELRAGFDTNSRRLLYTHIITYPNEKHFESVNMVRQLEVFGIWQTENGHPISGFPADRTEERPGHLGGTPLSAK